MAKTLVYKLDAAEAKALADHVRSGGFELKAIPHAAFSARGEGVVCTLYLSGKCVIQGAGAGQFVERMLPGRETPEEAEVREALLPERARLAVGSDESGKGDYFGPLVVAAVAFGPEYAALVDDLKLGDSKAISDPVIRRTAARIRESLPHSVVVIGPERYNQMHARSGNLNSILAWAHAVALDEVLEKVDAPVLVVDKFCDERFFRGHLKERARSRELIFRTKAESHPAVGAASILATDTFRRRLEALGRQVGVALPKGASSQVEAAARRLFAAKGFETLAKVAKLHFRTTQKVTGS